MECPSPSPARYEHLTVGTKHDALTKAGHSGKDIACWDRKGEAVGGAARTLAYNSQTKHYEQATGEMSSHLHFFQLKDRLLCCVARCRTRPDIDGSAGDHGCCRRCKKDGTSSDIFRLQKTDI